MQNLYEAYSKLYHDSYIPNGYRYKKAIHQFPELSHFTGMKGKAYSNQPIRFLLVGRAVNGWMSLDTSTSASFADHACSLFESDHFNWIVWDDTAKRLRNDISNPDEYYWLNKSPFWRISEQVWRAIPNTVLPDRFWGNLCFYGTIITAYRQVSAQVSSLGEAFMHEE